MSRTWSSNSKRSIMSQFKAWFPFFVICKRKEHFAISGVSESMNFTVCFIHIQKDTELQRYSNSKGRIMPQIKTWFPFFVIYKRKEHFVINGVPESMNFIVVLFIYRTDSYTGFQPFLISFLTAPCFQSFSLKNRHNVLYNSLHVSISYILLYNKQLPNLVT